MTLGYKINENGIEWLGFHDLSEEDSILNGFTNRQKQIDKCELFLTSELRSGPKLSTEITELAKKNCISKATLKRAKARLHIESVKKGPENKWMWRLAGHGFFEESNTEI